MEPPDKRRKKDIAKAAAMQIDDDDWGDDDLPFTQQDIAKIDNLVSSQQVSSDIGHSNTTKSKEKNNNKNSTTAIARPPGRNTPQSQSTSQSKQTNNFPIPNKQSAQFSGSVASTSQHHSRQGSLYGSGLSTGSTVYGSQSSSRSVTSRVNSPAGDSNLNEDYKEKLAQCQKEVS